ncbi:MAG: CBS domain-containing protein [Candidatus Aenigmarchaeota archaeon]|nr:CBS domain-containing protein [Candidatus Aenigmarchaeota archaeon]
MKIRDIMSKKVISAGPDESFGDIVEKLSRNGISGMPVVSGGKVVGVITQTDIIRGIDIFSGLNDASDIRSISRMLKGRDISGERVKKIHGKKVKSIMNKRVITISGEKSLYDAAKLINENGIDRLPVVSRGKLVGIVTKKDIIRAMERMEN